MTYQGSVKSFNGAKAYGFIVPDSGDIGDVFVHQRECGGMAPKVGDTVTFDAEESPSKPGTYVAKNVLGCTGTPEAPGGKGAAMGVEGTGVYQGSVKSFNDLKGWGFIELDGQDIFLHAKDMVDGSTPDRGDVLKFDLEDNPGKPGTFKATNATGGSKGKGKGKGNNVPLAFQGQRAEGTGAYQGSVKSFNNLKGWGFIEMDGQDIFLHVKDMVDGSMPDRGDVLKFDIEDNPGKPGTFKASNATGGSKAGGKGGGKGDYGKWGKGDSWGGDSWSGGGGNWGPYAWGDGGKGGGKSNGKSWGDGGGKGADAWGGGKSNGNSWGDGGKGGDQWGSGGKGGGNSWGDGGKSNGNSWGGGGNDWGSGGKGGGKSNGNSWGGGW